MIITEFQCGSDILEFVDLDLKYLHPSIRTAKSLINLGGLAKALAKLYQDFQEIGKMNRWNGITHQMWISAFLLKKNHPTICVHVHRGSARGEFENEELGHASTTISLDDVNLRIPLSFLSREGLTHILLHNNGVESVSATKSQVDLTSRLARIDAEAALERAIHALNQCNRNWPISYVGQCITP